MQRFRLIGVQSISKSESNVDQTVSDAIKRVL